MQLTSFEVFPKAFFGYWTVVVPRVEVSGSARCSSTYGVLNRMVGNAIECLKDIYHEIQLPKQETSPFLVRRFQGPCSAVTMQSKLGSCISNDRDKVVITNSLGHSERGGGEVPVSSDGQWCVWKPMCR